MSARPVRVGVLGAGAMGLLLAHALTRHTSAEVCLFARQPWADSVSVESAEGISTVPVRVCGRPAQPVDLLVVAVKAYATADALAWAQQALGPETVALTLQNGLGNAEILAASLGPGKVLAGTTAQGATLLAPGRVRHAGVGPTLLAPWASGDARRAEGVAELLRQAGWPAETAADPLPLLWGKVAVNCGINALTALLRVTNGELLRRPEARGLMEAAAREAGAVAAARGISLPWDPVERVGAVAAATGENRSSMLQDVERHRRTEIEAINGAVAARGRECGVQTPVNAVLTDLIRALDPAGEASG